MFFFLQIWANFFLSNCPQLLKCLSLNKTQTLTSWPANNFSHLFPIEPPLMDNWYLSWIQTDHYSLWENTQKNKAGWSHSYEITVWRWSLWNLTSFFHYSLLRDSTHVFLTIIESHCICLWVCVCVYVYIQVNFAHVTHCNTQTNLSAGHRTAPKITHLFMLVL